MLHIKEIKALFTSVITTGEKFAEDVVVNGIIQQDQKKGDLKLYQTVIAVGSSVRDIQVGDTVMIDPKNYAVMKYDKNSLKNDMDMNQIVKWDLPWVIIDDENGKPQDCLLLNDRDIKFVFEGEEKADSIILPDKPVIITN